jgi:hypothetical protein
MKQGEAHLSSAAWLCVLVVMAACARAATQAPAPPPPAAAPPPPPAQQAGPPAAQADQPGGGERGGGRRGGGGQQQQQGPQPYNRVITAEAQTSAGLFKVHRISERLYFEIPRAELGKDMVIMRRVVAGSGNDGNMTVTWNREGNRILLRRKTYNVSAQTAGAISRAVDNLNYGAIIAAFNIEAFGPDSAAVIETTRLFTTNISDFVGVQQISNDRNWIEWARAWPENVGIEATQTGQAAAAEGRRGGPPPDEPPGGRRGGGGGVQSARLHWSIRKLPEQPMMPRLHDTRVGYSSVQTIDYSRPDHRAETVRYIRRFRLEKRDPNAAVSEPVKPIEFWIDPATPEWLVPFVKQGIEAWQPAFQEAGFRNAIVGRVAPTPQQDPDWSPYDARYSIVYWRASTTQNATGGQQADPRTGEILKAEVNMFHNVMNLLRNWYFVQVSPLDPRAQQLPLPDDLMGRLVQYVVTHEVGHAIGFPHNMKASAMYPVDSLRSASFLRRMGGHTPTLMDYSRFNYVAQPEDRIPPELLLPDIGPYDKFAVVWGHKPVPNAKKPEDEKATLNQWAMQQESTPWFRFSASEASNDPEENTEAVGDADAVKSSTLGMKNLERVANSLLKVAEKPGQDYSTLDELYGNVVSQWGRYNGHVAGIVGGAYAQERYGTGPRFQPVEKERQREAVQYLNRVSFQVPQFILQPDVLRRVEPFGVVARIRQAQAGVLNNLFNEQRMLRLVEYEALEKPGTTYTLADLLTDLKQGVWGELDASSVRVDVYRRNLQRAYLESIDNLLNPPEPQPAAAGEEGGGGRRGGGGGQRYPSDVRAALRGHLFELQTEVNAAMPKAGDGMTRLHLRDLQMEIEKLLDLRPRV